MTEKQRRFCEEYLIDLNAKQAAIRAGYKASKEKTFEVIGCNLLKNTQVANEIARQMAERSKRTGVNQDRVIEEIAKIAFVNVAEVVDFENAEVLYNAKEEDLACISSVKVKTSEGKKGTMVEREIRFNSKIQALELLGRHLGMFNDKLKVDNVAEEEKAKKIDNIANILEQMHPPVEDGENNAGTV